MFENLKLDNIYAFLKLVHDNELYSNAVSSYSVYYTEMELTEKFITEIELIYDSGKGRKLTERIFNKNGELINKDELKKLLINMLLRNDCKYSESVNKFFELFDFVDGKYIYTPNEENRLKQSGIRNFLYELGVVELQDNNKTYELNIDSSFLPSEKLNLFQLSPEILIILLRINKEIGEKAELCVMDYERNRLKNNDKLLSMLEHVALTDVNAGYDILSWELTANTQVNIPRYIEVKAIPIKNNSRFFWSMNEIETARKYRDRYSLYLVPRIKDKFLINDIQIIVNPVVEIFEGSNWKSKVENYSIWSNN